MPPYEFLRATPARKQLKRKFSLAAPKDPEEFKQKLRLDPASIQTDRTILDYHGRVSQLLPEEQQKLHIAIRFNIGFDKLEKRVLKLENENRIFRGEP